MAKFLIYIEPHPIRNSMKLFGNVINYFSQFVRMQGKHVAKFYSNREMLDRANELILGIEEKCIYPTDEAEAFFLSQLIDWDTGGLAAWSRLMDDDSKIVDQYVEIIMEIYEEYKFDYIVCWGTNGAVKKAAKLLSVGFVNMELGCSRKPYKDTVVMDPWGVNGASTISKANICDFDIIEPQTGRADILQYGFNNGSLAYEELFRYVPFENIRTLMGANQKIAFIPLQLYDDANLVKYSPYEKVLDVLVDVLPKLSKEGYVCIIKEHPGSINRTGSQRANEQAKKYAKNFSNVIWLGKEYYSISNSFLCRISDVIITVNSSTGFESLFFEKALVVLGDAVYKVGGVFPTLLEIVDGFSVTNDYKRSIGKLRTFFYEYYLLDISIFNHPEILAEKIIMVGELSKMDCNVKDIVRWYIDNNFSK